MNGRVKVRKQERKHETLFWGEARKAVRGSKRGRDEMEPLRE